MRADSRTRSINRVPRLAVSCLTSAMLLAAACNPKDFEFFAPDEANPSGVLQDRTAPLIGGYQPSSDVPLNDVLAGFTVIDAAGPAGEPISGLDPASISVLIGPGGTLPVSQSTTPNYWNTDISSLQPGPITLNVRARDLAGNEAIGAITFRRDITAPVINSAVPATGFSTAPTATLPVAGVILEPYGISSSALYIRQPVNGTCTTNGPLFPEGTTAGTVERNTYDLGTTGSYNIGVLATGAPNNLRPRTTLYCYHISAADQAVNRTGAPARNVADQVFPHSFEWRVDQGSDFTISTAMSYVHVGPGVSYVCAQPTTSPGTPGASYTVNWSGPGTVGSTQRNGTLDALSTALDRQQINAFGTYTVGLSITYNGLTKQTTGNVNVGPAQGTCPPP